MQQSPATCKNQDVGIGLRKIVACSQSSSQCLLLSTIFGMVSSLHPTSFLMTYFTNFYAGLALTSTWRDDNLPVHVRIICMRLSDRHILQA